MELRRCGSLLLQLHSTCRRSNPMRVQLRLFAELGFERLAYSPTHRLPAAPIFISGRTAY